jgi:DNA recombination protein Rad52
MNKNLVKKLVGHLDPKHVQHREFDGKTLSYIEGWFAISEANAIFGFDGWDRETLQSERLFEQTRLQETVCAYSVRVRIRVHTGEREVSRDGTGIGVATAGFRADAHEKALKAAETDATKRALATFGNRFGLGLYHRDRSGHSHHLVLCGTRGEMVAEKLSPEGFCSGLRQLIERVNTNSELGALQKANAPMLALLKDNFPKLTSSNGTHFAFLIDKLFVARTGQLERNEALSGDSGATPPAIRAVQPSQPEKIDKSRLFIPTEQRIRNKAHLLFCCCRAVFNLR